LKQFDVHEICGWHAFAAGDRSLENSPDLNPIEPAFSKLKALPRKAASGYVRA